MDVRAPVADVDDALAGHAEAKAQIVERGDLAVARWDTQDRSDLAGRRVELEMRRDDPLWRNDPIECRIDHLLRRGGNDVEVEAIAVDAALEAIGEHVDVPLESNASSDVDQIIAAHAAKLRIVTEQIGELGSRLHEVQTRKSGNLLGEPGNAERFAQQVAGVIEAQRLIEIAHEQKVLRHASSPIRKRPRISRGGGGGEVVSVFSTHQSQSRPALRRPESRAPMRSCW